MEAITLAHRGNEIDLLFEVKADEKIEDKKTYKSGVLYC